MSARALFPRRLAFAAVALAGLAMAAGCSSSSSSSQPATSGSTGASPTAPAPGTSATGNSATGNSATGNSATGSHTAAASAPSSPAAAGPAPCATSSLHVTHGLGQGYAGGVYEVIDFTNTSSITCTLFGYPGVSLVSGPPYTQIGLPAVRATGAVPVKQITVAPGATANALLQIVDALAYPAATCGPAKAAALKIYPPNQTAPVYLTNATTGCSKAIKIMNIGPVQAGSGGSA